MFYRIRKINIHYNLGNPGTRETSNFEFIVERSCDQNQRIKIYCDGKEIRYVGGLAYDMSINYVFNSRVI